MIAWLKWEFGRRIEVTPVIRFIIIERFVKSTILIIVGLSLIVLSAKGVITDWANTLSQELNLDAGQGLIRRTWHNLVISFGSKSEHTQELIGGGAIIYALLEGGEGVGLLMRRRWAEYLVLIATLAFLPLEIEEVTSKVTVIRVGALLVNIAIAGYLIWKKRLFLERPGHEAVADKADAEPGMDT